MIVMINHGSQAFLDLAEKHPGRLGWLISPGAWRTPRDGIPYALDNGRYAAWVAGRQWVPEELGRLIDKAHAAERPPEWLVVPDTVGDRRATLHQWDVWAPRLEKHGWPLAMAVQDGMTPADVPSEAAVCFIGGTGRWKWLHLAHFTGECERVHVGRVNTSDKLWDCDELGVESVDGTGWFRNPAEKYKRLWLREYLERSSQGKGPSQMRMFTGGG